MARGAVGVENLLAEPRVRADRARLGLGRDGRAAAQRGDVGGNGVDVSGENTTGLRSISAPCSFAGIRPVLIWKSTAAAPAPTRLGPCAVPCASRP